MPSPKKPRTPVKKSSPKASKAANGSPSASTLDSKLFARLHEEAVDSFDEELEMELDDLAGMDPNDPGASPEASEFRRLYFRELLRLQGELVKLQAWVMRTKHKLVVSFGGRDAAGKGGVIKRITRRLNPRVCRVVALPAPTE